MITSVILELCGHCAAVARELPILSFILQRNISSSYFYEMEQWFYWFVNWLLVYDRLTV